MGFEDTPMDKLRRIVRVGFEDTPMDKLRRIVRDLDRCPHGRHQPDACSSCERQNGQNVGNIWRDGIRVGTTLDGKPIFLTDLLSAIEAVDA